MTIVSFTMANCLKFQFLQTSAQWINISWYFKFCTQVGHLNYLLWDEKMSTVGHGHGHVTFKHFWFGVGYVTVHSGVDRTLTMIRQYE